MPVTVTAEIAAREPLTKSVKCPAPMTSAVCVPGISKVCVSSRGMTGVQS